MFNDQQFNLKSTQTSPWLKLWAYLIPSRQKRIFEFYRTALDYTSIVAVTDAAGSIIYSNQAFSDISGYTEGELRGKNHRILNSKFHARDFFAEMWTTISAGKSWRGEIRNKRKDGKSYWVDTVILPVTDKHGGIEQFVAIGHDVTKRKEMEEGLIAARDLAERANRTKSEFLANMSHEIRTPMHAILGMADLLSETDLTPDQERYVRFFKRAGEDLLAIINGILDISKIESGHVVLDTSVFRLHDLMDELIEIFSPKAQLRNLKFSVVVDPELPAYFCGDPLRIRQVLINLVSNAIKFTESGSVKVHVGWNLKNGVAGNLLFTIVDTGIGIAQDKQSLLFQSFVQADSSVTKKFGGTGLGLVISKSLAKMMGGDIWFVSDEGVGTNFFFTLTCLMLPEDYVPEVLTLAKAEDVERPLVESIPDLQKLRILLVDDSDDNRILIKEYLHKYGHSIVEAENGEAAILKFQKATFDIVLMDIQMPIVDGYAATRSIRNWEAERGLSPTPIIALTAYALQEEQARCLAAGCNTHIAKPVKKRVLVETLQNFAIVKSES